MRNRRPVWIAMVLALALAPQAHAERLQAKDVPAPLQPWVSWVLRGHEGDLCPTVASAGGRCAWPSRLELDLDGEGGSFRQQWWVEVESRIELPGGKGGWPDDVTVDGVAAVVTANKDVPVLRLAPGRHIVAGRFAWPEMPQWLMIPPHSGLLRLRIGGTEIPFPSRELRGRLWLRGFEREVQSEDTLEVAVVRRVVDEIPMIVETRVELKVAGRNRELLLGKVLLDGFTPLSLTSPVPVRIESDGRLRAQLRPGVWSVTMTARQDSAPTAPIAELALGDAGSPWDEQEIWVFEARPGLRLVQVEGVDAVDPAQTTLPDEWRNLPAYLMDSGAAMQLVEKQRGDAPQPDRLKLERTWWLDFDGNGATVRDQIMGNIGTNTRLSMASPTELGRAALHDDDQLITRLTEDGPLGIEIRRGHTWVEADSRIDGDVSTLPAVGWDHDFYSVNGTLRLPPGWRLVHATGVDGVSRSWIASWTLWDIFLSLVTIAAFSRLWGLAWGAIAATAMLLTWIEPGAPQIAWVAVLAAHALVGAVERLEYPRLASVLRAARAIALIVLALATVSYAVAESRRAMFPVLEHARVSVGATAEESELDKYTQSRLRALGYAEPEQTPLADIEIASVARRVGKTSYSSHRQRMLAPDPNARVQTGPGVPAWQWNEVNLRWRGPVESSQQIGLTLLSPAANRALGFIRVLLVGALLLCVLRAAAAGFGEWRRTSPKSAATMLLAASLFAAPAARAADFPPQPMLDQLRDRLLERPECAPDCVSSPRLHVDISNDVLTLRVEVEAAARASLALPVGTRWRPPDVLIDGSPAEALTIGPEGGLWVLVTPGRHEIVLRGTLPADDEVQIHLRTRIHRVTLAAEGWLVGGVRRDGSAEGSLHLTRIAQQSAESAALEPGRLPPFVEIRRELLLGLEWSVTTTVVRRSPPGTAVALEVPLLAGESVLNAGIEVDDERATVALGPRVPSVSWTSAIKPTENLRLQAVSLANARERWLLTVGPMWHVEPSGIPAIQVPTQRGEASLEWRPWAGEVVDLAVTRPSGAAGRTLTIDKSVLTVDPGFRATDVHLALTLRSSRGAEHAVLLPTDATLGSVAIDGSQQPIRAVGRTLTLPIAPGRHSVAINWREPRGLGTIFRSPAVEIGATSVNATVEVQMPRDRWTLFAGGQQVGPVILFWPLLAVLVPVSFLLGRIGSTPLRARHWFLLGIGLTQVPLVLSLIVAGWLLALAWRGRAGDTLAPTAFDLGQLVLVAWTGLALIVLAFSVQQGLLGLPEMQIAGNGSLSHKLRWFQDRTATELPEVWVLSVPLLFYRAAMLLWALWLTQALLGWLRWGWSQFTKGGLWRPRAAPATE